MAGASRLRALVILGATGSIGRQTLDVAERLGLAVAGVAAGTPSPDLIEIATRHPDAAIAVATELPHDWPADLAGRTDFGPAAVTSLAAIPGATIINGIVGAAGLAASVAAVSAGNRLGLANKESLVVGGPVVTTAAHRTGAEIIPVDSEHAAVFHCLHGEPPAAVRRLILTASGGPFRRRTDLESVTVAEALAHPTWNMGPRITIDSASLMNKGLEVIEAHHLFGFEYDSIDVTIHPQSIVHSLVEFVDGTAKAELGYPDMRIPIQNAVTHPDRAPTPARPFDFAELTLTFEPPDRDTFPCLGLAYAAGRVGGTAPAVLNAADEVAVDAFLSGRIGFTGIPWVIETALERHEARDLGSVDDALDADSEGRRLAAGVVADWSR